MPMEQQNKLLESKWLNRYPDRLLQVISRLAGQRGLELFLVGGAVRDSISGSSPQDLDIAMLSGSLAFGRALAAELSAAFVLLDPEEGVCRLVWHGFVVDLADFRQQTTSIEEDLLKRDFSINAMAVCFPVQSIPEIIDPSGGLADFKARLVRVVTPEAFKNDPLRLLRAFRFSATLGFQLEPNTRKWIGDYGHLFGSSAPERISSELEHIMASKRAGTTIAAMVENGLFWRLFPELEKGVGMDQPASHHLDVFSHGLAALAWMEKVQDDPGHFFPGEVAEQMALYLENERHRVQLKWAALFHDLGKPDCHAIRKGRITFYNHDQVGAAAFEKIGTRLRWSRDEIHRISRLIRCHMWPFHLNNAGKKTGVTAKACLRLVKAIDDDLPGLFLLAMADSLAGQGEGKPPAMEQELAELYARVDRVCREKVKPVLDYPPLVNGHDLINLGLRPGPHFKKILSKLEQAQVEGRISTRDEGLAWLKSLIAGKPVAKSCCP